MRCSSCGETKDSEEFRRRYARRNSELSDTCRDCANATLERLLDAYPDLRPMFLGQHRSTVRASINTRRHRERHPERARARTQVTQALQSGRLKRLPCEICGERKAHGHHDDYSKPLEVRWLCAKHHRELHAKLREEILRTIASEST